MSDANASGVAGNQFNLSRFVDAQNSDYDQGPCLKYAAVKNSPIGCGTSFHSSTGWGLLSITQRYSIKSVAEAKAYLNHPILGPRLMECAEAAVNVDGRTALDIIGFPDNMKLRSCTTLFAYVSPAESVFDRLLKKYFDGVPDDKTLDLINGASDAK